MATSRITRILVKLHLLRLRPALLCLFMGWALLVVGGNYIDAPRSVAKASLIREELAQLASAQLAGYGFTKLGIPVESNALPGDREIPNENDPEDDLDSDSHLTFAETLYTVVSDEPVAINWAPYSASLFQNPSPVPLFVLHHSWKTFLV